jgi:LuxR family maltose regulon positive regulatory protein
LTIAREVGLLAHPSTADAFLALAMAALEAGEPGAASLSLYERTLRAEANRRSQLSWFGHLEAALLQEAEGQRELAATTAFSTRNDLGAPPPPIVADRLLGLQSRLLRLGGSPDGALRALGNTISHSTTLTFESASAALALGDRERARKLIDAIPHSAESDGPLAAVERLLVLAWLADSDESDADAQRYLGAAIEIAERNSLVEVFVRAGPTIVRLVSGFRGIQSDFRERILTRARKLKSTPPGGDLVEPLTDRELEILSLLPSRLTNVELADQCYVSVNTIKTHMAHIYRKLGVFNRNGAIARAQEIGIL